MKFALVTLLVPLAVYANDPANTPPGVQSKGVSSAQAVSPAAKNAAPKGKAIDPTNPPIKAGVEITVNDYHKDTDVFMITMTAEPDVGPNFATSAALQKALDHEGSLKNFIKMKDNLIGSIFTLKSELPLVEPEALVTKYKKVLKARQKKN